MHRIRSFYVVTIWSSEVVGQIEGNGRSIEMNYSTYAHT